jgi:hypothetical protein
MGLGETQSKKIKIDFLMVNYLNDASININYFPFYFTTFAHFLEKPKKEYTKEFLFSRPAIKNLFKKSPVKKNFTENEFIIQ